MSEIKLNLGALQSSSSGEENTVTESANTQAGEISTQESDFHKKNTTQEGLQDSQNTVQESGNVQESTPEVVSKIPKISLGSIKTSVPTTSSTSTSQAEVSGGENKDDEALTGGEPIVSSPENNSDEKKVSETPIVNIGLSSISSSHTDEKTANTDELGVIKDSGEKQNSATPENDMKDESKDMKEIDETDAQNTIASEKVPDVDISTTTVDSASQDVSQEKKPHAGEAGENTNKESSVTQTDSDKKTQGGLALFKQAGKAKDAKDVNTKIEAKPAEIVGFNNYESSFEKKSEKALKKMQNFKYGQQKSRSPLVLGLFACTLFVIGGLVFLMPEKQAFQNYKASLMDIYAEMRVGKDSQTQTSDILVSEGSDLSGNDKNNDPEQTSKNYEEMKKTRLREHLLKKVKLRDHLTKKYKS